MVFLKPRGRASNLSNATCESSKARTEIGQLDLASCGRQRICRVEVKLNSRKDSCFIDLFISFNNLRNIEYITHPTFMIYDFRKIIKKDRS